MPLITKEITAFGEKMVLGCDGKCSKAWGISGRPRVQMSEDEDDYAFKADDELGAAPAHPGSWEGNDTKPQLEGERLNKWCYRECERSRCAPLGNTPLIPSFLGREYNLCSRQVLAQPHQ